MASLQEGQPSLDTAMSLVHRMLQPNRVQAARPEEFISSRTVPYHPSHVPAGTVAGSCLEPGDYTSHVRGLGTAPRPDKGAEGGSCLKHAS